MTSQLIDLVLADGIHYFASKITVLRHSKTMFNYATNSLFERGQCDKRQHDVLAVFQLNALFIGERDKEPTRLVDI